MYCHTHHCHYHHCNCVPKDSKEIGRALTQEELLALTQEMKEELKDYTVDLKDQIFSYIDIGVNPVEIANTFASLKEQDTYILRTLTHTIDELNNTTNLSLYNLRTRVTDLEGQGATLINELSDRTQRIEDIENNLSSFPFEDGVLADTFVTVTSIDGTTDRTQHDKNREIISVLDFFTPTEMSAYRADNTTFDAHRPIQEFFDYICANNVGTARIDGSFYVGSALLLGGVSGSKTKQIHGNCHLNALTAIDTMLTIQAGQDFFWNGFIGLRGTGSNSYVTKTCRVGLRVGGEYLSSRNVISSISSNFFSQCGVVLDDLTSLTSFGDVRASDCGSGVAINNYSLKANYSNRVDSGTTSSQRSKINVSVLPPDVIETQCFIRIGSEYHYVYDIDRVSSTLSVFPILEDSSVSGELDYVFGGGLYIKGKDASVNNIGKLDAKRCSIGMYDTALYGAVFGTIVAQSCGVAMAYGASQASAHVGGSISGIYFENNNCDLLRVTRANLNLNISTEYAFNPSKVKYTCATRVNNRLIEYNNLDTVIFNLQGVTHYYVGKPNNASASTERLTIEHPNSVRYLNTNRGNLNISIRDINETLNSLFGYDSLTIVVFGDGTSADVLADSTPSGTISITAPTGYTFTDGSSVFTLSGFDTAPTINLKVMFASKTIKLSCLGLTAIPADIPAE